MMLAVIRIKGKVNIKRDIERTMQLLKLYKKHHCSVFHATKDIIGMINRIDRYVTWGEIDAKTLKLLIEHRGRLPGNKKITDEYIKEKTGKTTDEVIKAIEEAKISFKDIPGLKSFFRLKPPTKGFEAEGIRQPYSLGGVFGYRGKDINSLLERML